VVLAGLAAAMVLTAGTLGGLDLAGCLGPTPGVDCVRKLQTAEELSGRVRYLLLAGSGVPVLAGAVLGIALVGRELEQGTAVLAWSFAPSRRRWLLDRWFVVGTALFLLCLMPAVAANYLTAAANPTIDPGSSLTDYALRGWGVPARAIAVYGIASVIGLVVGRVLPGLLVSLVAAWLALVLVGWGTDWWLSRQVTELPLLSSGDLVSEILYRDPTGRLVTYATAIEQLEGTGELPDGNYPMVRMGVPGSEHARVEALETFLLGAVGLLALATGIIVIDRRRPT